jgi:hypothetical protein
MGRRAKVATMPRDIREWLDALLVRGEHGGYEALAALLAERGVQIGKSSLQRYDVKLQRRLQSIRDATEAARALAAGARDDAGDLSASVLAMVQTEMFDLLVNLREATSEDDPAERAKLLGRLAKTISESARASVAQKKWAAEVRTKTEAAAARADKIARKGGLSEDAAAQIRAASLGIAA